MRTDTITEAATVSIDGGSVVVADVCRSYTQFKEMRRISNTTREKS